MVGVDDGCKTSCDVNNDHNDEDDDDDTDNNDEYDDHDPVDWVLPMC